MRVRRVRRVRRVQEAQMQGSFNAKTIRKVQLSQVAAGAVAGGKDFID